MITEEIEQGRIWQNARVSDYLVICPSCAAVIMWKDKAIHRRFHAELVTALTASILNQPELVNEDPPF